MIQLTCDRCERVIEVEDHRAGEKLECPDCGDVNVVPAKGSSRSPGSANSTSSAVSASESKPRDQARPDRAASQGYPPENGPEVRVLSVHPALMRANPLVFLGMVVALLAGGGGVAWFGVLGKSASWTWLTWPSGALLLFAFVVIAIWKVQKLSHSLEVTTKRSIEKRGLLSRRTSEVLHDNIRNIQIEQTFLQRLMNVGTLSIASSGQEGVEIQVEDLPGPDDIRKVIDLYRAL